MAHKKSSKKTSFGKKSAPEKAYIKKGRKSRNDESEERPKRSFGRSSSFSSDRPGKFEGNRFSKRDSRRPEDEDKPKSIIRRSPSSSASRPNRSDGDRYDDKPRRSFSRPSDSSADKPKRTEGDFSSKRPRRKTDSEDKPKRSFSRSSNPPPSWSKGSEEKGYPKKDSRRSSDSSPFSKRPSFEKRSSDKPFSTDRKRSAQDDFAPKRSGKSLGFTKRKSFTKTSPSHSGPGKEPKTDDGLTRLNKHIANSGMGSRREADEMIKKGLISVNGVTIIEMGFKVKQGDVVRYEDKVLKAEKPVYVLLNKPKGFITTTADPQERKTVMNLVANACKERLYPVGRLDRNTTGLLLLTNDGDLAAKLTHPSYNTKKIYKVELDRPLTKNDFQKIVDGIHLEEGKVIVDDLAYASDDKKTIGIELHIGWNRIVRRIFESLEYEVAKLDRVIFAGLDKKDLPRGEWRFLKPEEVVRLKHFK